MLFQNSQLNVPKRRTLWAAMLLRLFATVPAFADAEERSLDRLNAEFERACSLWDLACLVENQDRYDEARKLFERSREAFEKSGGSGTDVADCHNKIAWMWYYLDNYGEAETHFKKAVKLRKKKLGTDHMDYAWSVSGLGDALYQQGRFKEAAERYEECLAIGKRHLNEADSDLAVMLYDLGCTYNDLERYDEAYPLLERALRIRVNQPGEDDLDVADCYRAIGLVHWCTEKYEDAAKHFEKRLEIARHHLSAEDWELTQAALDLADAYSAMAQYEKANGLYESALITAEKLLVDDQQRFAEILTAVGDCYLNQSSFEKSQQCYQRAVRILREQFTENAPELIGCLTGLANVNYYLGKIAEAEVQFRRILEVAEKHYGASDNAVAATLFNLADVFVFQDRFAEAEALYQRVLRIREDEYGPDDTIVAWTLRPLASVYLKQGRFADAELLYKRALSIVESKLGDAHPQVAAMLQPLAVCYCLQDRFSDAEPYATRATQIMEKTHGRDHIEVAYCLWICGDIEAGKKRFADAERLYSHAKRILQKTYGDSHPDVCQLTVDLADVYRERRKFGEAENLLKNVLPALEKQTSPLLLATNLRGLSEVYFDQNKYHEALPQIDRAISLSDGTGVSPGYRAESYLLRARISWNTQRRHEALADLRHAMTLAEQQRVHLSGTERERAGSFAKYAAIFEQMVAWQVELGDANEALAAMERHRARSMMDELALAGADLELSRSAAEREELQNRESELKQRSASLLKQIELLQRQKNNENAQELKSLQQQLTDTRQELYEHFQKQRTTNPVYRNLLSAGVRPPRVSELRRTLVQDDGLLFVYMLGDNGGYLLTVDAKDTKLTALNISDPAAKALGMTPGPLTAARLRSALVNADGEGVLQQLKTAHKARLCMRKLAALWSVLVPSEYRGTLTSGDVNRLVVIPDGHLALLPFETLVVGRGQGGLPEYLLDVGPPIHYGPSAAIVYNLANARRAMKSAASDHPVLTVGDPQYGAGAAASTRTTASSRYANVGGQLSRLPFSQVEAQWVRRVFADRGVASTVLTGHAASENNVVQNLAGRQFVHLACHGITDQSFGNFFGALALTADAASPNGPATDGFLTLAEIYELDLKGCDLTILSACDTNVGPQQRGEGVWALSRGFLVAGSRRVVASNWLVDDRAAASLVSYFCSGIARQRGTAEPIDYATSLHNAKRWVRNQEKWASPYYWGTFVLLGPN